MNDFKFICALIRVLGVAVLASVVVDIPEYIFQYFSSNSFSILNLIKYLFFANSLTILFGLVCILYANNIEKTFFSNNKIVTNVLNINISEEVLIKLLGLYFVFHSLSDVVFHISNYYMLSDDISDFTVQGYNYPLVVATVVEIILSVIMIFCPGIFSKRVS